MTFQLDTTGTVDADKDQHIALDGQLYIGVGWGILSPFAQGYVEALFAGLPPKERAMTDGATVGIPHRFRDLAPETLARIIADCGPDPQGYLYPTSARMGYQYTFEGGHKFWTDRQAGVWADFLPLTVTLGDDGKVRFAA